jgi:hypothetical protein
VYNKKYFRAGVWGKKSSCRVQIIFRGGPKPPPPPGIVSKTELLGATCFDAENPKTRHHVASSTHEIGGTGRTFQLIESTGRTFQLNEQRNEQVIWEQHSMLSPN